MALQAGEASAVPWLPPGMVHLAFKPTYHCSMGMALGSSQALLRAERGLTSRIPSSAMRFDSCYQRISP